MNAAVTINRLQKTVKLEMIIICSHARHDIGMVLHPQALCYGSMVMKNNQTKFSGSRDLNFLWDTLVS